MKKRTKPTEAKHLFYASGAASPKILSVDAELFQRRLDHWAVSDTEKAEYLDIVWQIVCQFVDLGYGIHPLKSSAQQSCGQHLRNSDNGEFDPENSVASKRKRSTEQACNVAFQCAAEKEES